MVKVGDKIRILCDKASSADVKKGDMFTVTEILSCGDIRVMGNRIWRFGPEDFEIISKTPPQKITKNGYEYSLVGPVKPDWLVDGAWVVRKDNGCKHQVVLNKNGLLVLTMPGTDATILPNHHIYDQYRPHTVSDWKWGDWAMYRGKRVFVIGRVEHTGMIGVSSLNLDEDGDDEYDKNYAFIRPTELTPTF